MLRDWKHRWRTARARADVTARLREPPAARAHGLPSPLVVSLTSYPRRFGTLALTLGGLLTQTVQADATILWLGDGQASMLPPDVLSLRSRSLTIAETRDLRSYTKIVPALLAHPEAAIVTADDDVHYEASWLGGLVAAMDGPRTIPCHRAHRVRMSAGAIASYEDWDRNIRAPERGPLVFPTGVMGVLYPPGGLHEEATRADLFQELSPTADDVWLWWMHRMAGSTARKVGGRSRVLEWPASQEVNLRAGNMAGAGNDRAVAAMTARYGLPPTFG
ncbi:glycosyltransferase family 2 protein [Rubellimicrobium arenae]|uniref:glycosyltransferase family 2 protein n=1 Tax=Rubellimicrobium arenae TaxID=2817372 RepID=UPI001B3154C7|nr:glycosyltransferase family 2 protein [Rubellimicrobium arenae]